MSLLLLGAGSSGPAVPAPPSNAELREDGGYELREDGGYEERE
jgi:hypothetical protein